jgi:hypothetical protein
VPLPLPLLHAVPLATWAALFEAHGVKRAPRSLDDVRAAALEPSSTLAAALRTLRALARDDARPAMLLAARVLGVDGATWPSDVPAAGLAAALLARVPEEPPLAELLRAAELHLCRREASAPKRRYVGRSAGEPATTPAALKALGAAIERANDARQAHGRVSVTVARSDARALVLDVVRPEPPSSDLVMDRRGALSRKAWTPVAVDRVVLDREKNGTCVLWVATAAPELLGAYRLAVGEALLGDASFFAAARAISLRAMQRHGRTALRKARAGHPRLRDARVVSVVWDPGREETLTIDGRDVLATVEREELPSHGRVLGARVRLDFDDGPIDVTLRAPNVVHWEPSSHDDAVRAFVGALSLDEPANENLVTLAPHDHAAWLWRAALGDDLFESLRARGMFTESTSRALGHPGLPGAGRIMLAFSLGAGGRYYVVAEEGFDAEPWLADERDLVTYRLDVAKLAAEIQRELFAEGDPPRVLERGSLVDLGTVAVGGAQVRLYLVIAARAIEGLAERLRERSAGAQPVLIVPRGAKADMGCAEVEMDGLGGPYAGILAAVARVTGVAAALGPWARAPAGTRLVVEKNTGRVWLDGVELVALPGSARTLARVLVAAGGRPVAGGECDRKLSGARQGSGAAKKARGRFVRGVTKSFALAGREAPKDVERIIEGTRMGYRVTVAAWMG